jgi:hypothetical protein
MPQGGTLPGVPGYRDESEIDGKSPSISAPSASIRDGGRRLPDPHQGDASQVVLDQIHCPRAVEYVNGGTTASAEDGISHWPSVVVVNRLGQEKRLGQFESNEEAEARAERVQADLDILGLEGWCKRYNVPLAFARA